MKGLVENCLALDLGALTRAGAFRVAVGTLCECFWTDAAGQKILRIEFHLSGGSSPRFIHLSQNQVEGATATPITLRLTSVRCNFGGAKYFVRCAGKDDEVDCGRLVRKLYLIDGMWMCRSCGDLTYIARRRHDRRIDALCRDPMAFLAALHSEKPSRNLLAVRAAAEELGKLCKRKI